MRKRITDWILRRGAEVALKTASEAVPKLVPGIAPDEYNRDFEVQPPVTVYLYASHARVTVRRADGNHVRLNAGLRAPFGWQLVTEQDEAGVYIVAKRKPVVGALSSAEFILSVPNDTRLLVELTPGALVLEDLDGKLEVSAVTRRGSPPRPSNPPTVPALPPPGRPTRR